MNPKKKKKKRSDKTLGVNFVMSSAKLTLTSKNTFSNVIKTKTNCAKTKYAFIS